MRPPYSKYRAKKIVDDDGNIFDSLLEYRRYQFLTIEQQQGRITNLQRQVRYTLIPTQYIYEPRHGKRGQLLKPKQRVAEKECYYLADFVFDLILDDGRTVPVIEDAKGLHTKEYIIKRKLMRLHGNIVSEVKKATQPIQYQYIYSDSYDNTLSLQS